MCFTWRDPTPIFCASGAFFESMFFSGFCIPRGVFTWFRSWIRSPYMSLLGTRQPILSVMEEGAQIPPLVNSRRHLRGRKYSRPQKGFRDEETSLSILEQLVLSKGCMKRQCFRRMGEPNAFWTTSLGSSARRHLEHTGSWFNEFDLSRAIQGKPPPSRWNAKTPCSIDRGRRSSVARAVAV